jgi:hypothetical protein
VHHRPSVSGVAPYAQLPGCSVATLILPKQVPLHFNVIGTRNGAWRVRVDSVLASRECENVALQLVLEGAADDECANTRRLYMVCSEPDLHNPQQRALIADRIRRWLENTEGNGALNLTQENVYAA